MAVKDLVAQLADRNIRINFKKVAGTDPFIYQLELPEYKTSGLMPRSARNRFGTPFSHLPTDKILRQKLRLNLSGGTLMVQTGGGHKNILDFLDHKGFFYGSPYTEA